MEKKLYTLIVHSENIAGLLNQITAVFTRRQLNIESLNASASSIKGIHRYTITTWSDEDTIIKVTKQIEKKIDVVQAHYFLDDEIFMQEVALLKISTPKLLENPLRDNIYGVPSRKETSLFLMKEILKSVDQKKFLLLKLTEFMESSTPEFLIFPMFCHCEANPVT
jgi:acetolactate synthase small subunit